MESQEEFESEDGVEQHCNCREEERRYEDDQSISGHNLDLTQLQENSGEHNMSAKSGLWSITRGSDPTAGALNKESDYVGSHEDFEVC